MKASKFLAIAAFTVMAATTAQNLKAEVIQNHDNSDAQEILSIKTFDTVQNGTSKKAVIFVGGVNDTYNFWSEHIKKLENENVTIMGYSGPGEKGSHPFNVEYLEENANHIKNGILKLKQTGIEEIHIISHSLGGVVSKKALHMLDEQNETENFNEIKFTAVSPPLGGFMSAIIPYYQPFAKQISKFFNLAMIADMNPFGEFYESISKPLNPKIVTTLIESKDDPVAQPTSEATKERYNKIASTFNTIKTLDGKKSHEFAQNPETLEEQGVNLFEKQKIMPKLPSDSDIYKIRHTNYQKPSFKIS